MAYWKRKLSYSLEPQETIKPGDGLNQFNTAFEIKKSECVTCNNVGNRLYPALSVRQGTLSLYDTVLNPIYIVRGVGVRDGTTFIVQADSGVKYWDTGTSAFVNIVTVGAADSTITEFNTATTRYTLIFNSSSTKAWDGVNVTTLADAPKTNLIAVDDSRIYALKDSTLYFSALDSISDWTTIDDAGTIDIVGMQGTGTALTAYNDTTICWSDKTMHLLYGNDPFDYQLADPIMCGCVSNRSVQKHNGILYFMDYNRLMSFTGGIPVEFGQKVKAYLDGIWYTYKDKIASGQWKKYLYWSIPFGDDKNTMTLEYDTELKTWFAWDQGYAYFYNIGQNFYGVTPAGVVKQLHTGTADDSTAITWSWTSGVWDGMPLRQNKVISNIWAIIDLPVGSTMTISYSTKVDSGTFTTLQTFTTSSDEQNTRVQVPTTALQNINWYRIKLSGTGPATIFYLEPHIRVKAR